MAVFRRGNANIRSTPLMSAAKVEADVREVAGYCDVVAWQEIKTKPYVDAILSLLGWEHFFALPVDESGLSGTRVTARYTAAGNQVPISWRRDRFTLVSKGIVEAHPAGLGSPARYVAWVILRDRLDGSLSAHIGVHFIHQAWTSHPERRPRWNKHVSVLLGKIRELRKDGMPVVVTGDFNRPATGKWGNWWQREPDLGVRVPVEDTFGSAEYDYIFLTDCTGAAQRAIDLYSDHDLVVCTITTPAPKPPPEPEPKPEPKPVDWRGTQIEIAREALNKASRPSVQADIDAALAILDGIRPLGG